MNKILAILGAGGHGKVVADAALQTGKWGCAIFFDDAFPDKKFNGDWPVVGAIADIFTGCIKFDGVVVAIGENHLRLKKTVELKKNGLNVVSIIHPSAVVSSFSSINPGCVVLAGAVINVAAKLGYGCIVNTGAVVEHDCCLSDGVHLSPNVALAGKTHVGNCSWVGIGAVTKELITIGRDVTVGAGSVVLRSVLDGSTVVGNPAQTIKQT